MMTSDRIDSVDWTTAAFSAAGCVTHEEWVADGWSEQDWDQYRPTVTTADLTGDGTPEVYAQFQCPTAANSNPDMMVVFDVGGAEPRAIEVLGGDLYFRGAKQTVGDKTVTFEGPTVGADDPRCCTAHRGKVAYTWDGSIFTVTVKEEALTTQPILHQGWPDGEFVGILRGIGDHEVLVDEVQWFAYPNALAPRLQDDPGAEPDLCTDYYVRNINDLVRAVRVRDDASITYLDVDTSVTPVPVDARQLERLQEHGAVDDHTAAEISVSSSPYFRFISTGGDITSMEQIFIS